MEASPKKFSGVGGVAVCKESAVVHMNQVRSITIDETFTVTVKMMNFDLPQEVKNRDGKSRIAKWEIVRDVEEWRCGRKMWETWM